MESSIFLTSSGVDSSSSKDASTGAYFQWLGPLIRQQQRVNDEVHAVFNPQHEKSLEDGEDPALNTSGSADHRSGQQSTVNLLEVHATHRRRLYLQHARSLSHVSDAHFYYKFMMWCHDHHLFVHPCVRMHRRPSEFRDHVFTVKDDVPRLTPLLAIPERLVIGFRDANADDDDKNTLYDEEKEKEFQKQNFGDAEASNDADICKFFFASLGMIVADLFTAKSSQLTDPRYFFAESLGKVRTLQNAPFFDNDATFSPEDAENPCLADVLLQMIRNYVNGGPLVNKVPKEDLQWAVSVCLSHATPLTIGSVQSIGIIPFLHFFPHGGQLTNAYVVARTGRTEAARKMAAFFNDRFGYDFTALYEGRWIYVVPERDLKAGEEIHVQAMAPVCDKDSEAEQMWQLTCGSVPSSYRSSASVARRQWELTEEILTKGGSVLKANGAP